MERTTVENAAKRYIQDIYFKRKFSLDFAIRAIVTRFFFFPFVGRNASASRCEEGRNLVRTSRREGKPVKTSFREVRETEPLAVILRS